MKGRNPPLVKESQAIKCQHRKLKSQWISAAKAPIASDCKMNSFLSSCEVAQWKMQSCVIWCWIQSRKHLVNISHAGIWLHIVGMWWEVRGALVGCTLNFQSVGGTLSPRCSAVLLTKGELKIWGVTAAAFQTPFCPVVQQEGRAVWAYFPHPVPPLPHVCFSSHCPLTFIGPILQQSSSEKQMTCRRMVCLRDECCAPWRHVPWKLYSEEWEGGILQRYRYMKVGRDLLGSFSLTPAWSRPWQLRLARVLFNSGLNTCRCDFCYLVSGHLPGRKCFPYTKLPFALFPCVPVSPHPSTERWWEESASISSMLSLLVVAECNSR